MWALLSLIIPTSSMSPNFYASWFSVSLLSFNAHCCIYLSAPSCQMFADVYILPRLHTPFSIQEHTIPDEQAGFFIVPSLQMTHDHHQPVCLRGLQLRQAGSPAPQLVSPVAFGQRYTAMSPNNPLNIQLGARLLY